LCEDNREQPLKGVEMMRPGVAGWIVLILSGLAIAMLLVPQSMRSPVLIWNATPSAPVGLYLVTGKTLETGRRVAVRPPQAVRELGVRYRLMRSDDLLIKTAAARSGDVLCEREGRLERNGLDIGGRGPVGPGPGLFASGAPCRRLRPGELLLLGDGERSWDGRSFGLVSEHEVVGVVEPLVRGAGALGDAHAHR
jgi:type IV secretory pathway protease TraF